MENLLMYYAIPILLFILLVVCLSDASDKTKKCPPEYSEDNFSREEVIVLAYMYVFIKPQLSKYTSILNSLSEEFGKSVDTINEKYNQMVKLNDPHIGYLKSLGLEKSNEKLDDSIKKIIG